MGFQAARSGSGNRVLRLVQSFRAEAERLAFSVEHEKGFV